MMRRHLLVAVLALLAALSCAKVETRTSDEGIFVRGVGKVEARPDIAFLSIAVQAQGANVQAVRTEAANAMTRVIGSLRESGVSQDDIQTSFFVVRSGSGQNCDNIVPPVLFPGGPPTPSAFCVSNRVEARIRNLDRIGQILDAAIAAGGPPIQVQGLQFTVEKPEALIEEAKAKALADGRDQARILAEAMAVRLGRLRSVSTSAQVPSVGFSASAPFITAPRTGPGGADTPIALGLFDLVVTASLRYDID